MSDFRIEESDTVEYKEIVNDSLIKEVVSFLNYKKGGHIYVGINNEGKTTGVLNPKFATLLNKKRHQKVIFPTVKFFLMSKKYEIFLYI